MLPVGDATKAQRQLGWKPAVDFKGLVRMMVQADLEWVGRWKRKRERVPQRP